MKQEEKDKIIEHISQNPTRLREKYINRNFTEFYDEIIEHNIKHNLPKEIKFLEKIWYYINDVTEKIMCESCGVNEVNFDTIKKGYLKTCSANCSRRKKPRPQNEEVDIKYILEKQRRMAESYIKTHFKYIYDNIINYIKEHDLPKGIDFKEKLWYYHNKIAERIMCRSCTENPVSFDTFNNGYKTYCSSTCMFPTKEETKPCNQKEEEDIPYILENSIRMRESYIKRNFKYLYDNVLKYIKRYDLPTEIPFIQKLWYYVNKETCKKVCGFCKEKSVSFNNKFENGYRKHCSNKCYIEHQNT